MGSRHLPKIGLDTTSSYANIKRMISAKQASALSGPIMSKTETLLHRCDSEIRLAASQKKRSVVVNIPFGFGGVIDAVTQALESEGFATSLHYIKSYDLPDFIRINWPALDQG